MSALESMFTAKPSSSKAEKGKSEKPQDANDVGHEEVGPKLNWRCMTLQTREGVRGLSYKTEIPNNQTFQKEPWIPKITIICEYYVIFTSKWETKFITN